MLGSLSKLWINETELHVNSVPGGIRYLDLEMDT